jgi:hypothetical protein
MHNEEVIEMVAYLRETIAKFDHAIAEMQANRTELAGRLAAIEAGTDPDLRAAADDYAHRVRTNSPYEDAMPAETMIREVRGRIRD